MGDSHMFMMFLRSYKPREIERPTFTEDLTNALAETGATLGFDATGGGDLTSHILAAMEAAATRSAKEFSRYGSTVQKQVYRCSTAHTAWRGALAGGC
jgi:hypothetical protein